MKNIVLSNILDIVDFLNHNGYQISLDDTKNYFRFFSESECSLVDEEDAYTAMEIFFSKDEVQQREIRSLVQKYINNKEALSKVQSEIEKTKSAKRKWKEEKEKGEKSPEETLKRKFSESEKDSELIKDIQNGKKSLEDISLEDIQKEMEKLTEDFKKAVLEEKEKAPSSDTKKEGGGTSKGGLENKQNGPKKEDGEHAKGESTIKAIMAAFQNLKTLLKEKENDLRKKQKAEEENAEFKNKLSDLLKEKKDLESGSFVSDSDKLLLNTDSTLLMRSLSEVRYYPEVFEYLRLNRNRFKSKFQRKIKTHEKSELNIEETIKHACRTGGVPIKLVYNKKVRSKTKLVMLLDVSGSCVGASELMLTMMYDLQELFPHGVHAFAFVDKLYDISEILKVGKAETAIRAAIDAVPSLNHWSNYEAVINEFWEKERGLVDNNTFFIVIGDARNNRFKANAKKFSEIAERAKETWWLNTEENFLWDTGDSVAGSYAPFCKMVEVTNLDDLFNFVGND